MQEVAHDSSQAVRDARTQRALAWLLVVGAAILRLWFVLKYHPPGDYVDSDMWVYDTRARNLLSGQLDAWDTFTPPGYPAMLALGYALSDGSRAFVGILQALLGGASALLTQHIARRVTGSRATAWIAGVAVALHLPLVLYCGFLLSEVPFACVLALSVLCLLRVADQPRSLGRMLAAGALLGVATVVRPNLLALYPLLPLYFWHALPRPSARASLRASGLVFLMALIPLGAACAHNSRITGRFTGVATNGGLNFFLNFADVSLVKYREGKREHTIAPIPNLIRHQRELRVRVPFYDDGFYYRAGLAAIRERPSRLLRAADNWREGLGFGVQDYWPGLPGHDRLLARYSKVFGCTVIAAALLHALWMVVAGEFKRRAASPRLLLLLVVLSSLIVMYSYLGDPRVRVPFDPLLIVLGLDAFARALGLARQRLTEHGAHPSRNLRT